MTLLSEDGSTGVIVIWQELEGVYCQRLDDGVIESRVHTNKPIPVAMNLMSTFPNPFNSSTRVSYTLPYPMNIELGIYDLHGRKLQVLSRGTRPAGAHSFNWDASGLQAGSYILRMADEGGRMRDVKKVVLVK